jgi:hypothetical protein
VTAKHSYTLPFNKPGASLGDLRTVARYSEQAPDDATVKVRLYFGGRIRSVTVEWEDPGSEDCERCHHPVESGTFHEPTAEGCCVVRPEP